MKDLKPLEESLKTQFVSKKLLEQALTHRSYLNESHEAHSSNERREFLGDAILSYTISDYLYREFPMYTEGELTNLRSAIVRTTTLALVAKKLNFGHYLLLSRGEEEGGGRDNPSLLADSFESISGAIFIDQGLEAATKFILENLIPLIPEIIEKRTYRDFKSQFQEKVQEILRISPTYKVMKEEGPDHSKIFHIGVYVNEELFGTGKGKSKQEAEQDAAASGLVKWEEKR